jgi:aminoglycoside phosphotransferase (APT) family kinase protein
MDFQKLFDEKIESIDLLEEGFSPDLKYVINQKYVVRVIDKSRYDRFKRVFDIQRKFYKVALCQKPIDLKMDDEHLYYITEYLEGDNGLNVIEFFDTKKQYDFGLEAGLELAKFHRTYPLDDFSVKDYIDYYFEDKVKQASSSNVGLYVEEIDDIIDYVSKRKSIFYSLHGVLSHSDYHLFNMIFNGDTYKGVIDFERCRRGIFLTDFRNNTPHNSPKSPCFASGFIDGYRSKIDYDNFFELYNIHDLMMAIASIPWTMEYNPEELDREVAYIKALYRNRKQIKKAPVWYNGDYIK